MFHYKMDNMYIKNLYSTVKCFISVMARPVQNQLCQPSTCGSNAACQESAGTALCTCFPNYFGNPYEGCRPECVVESDCALNLACVRMKCQNPCPGSCGVNAICQVVNHLPICSCMPGYSGDSFRYCSFIQTKRKPVSFGNYR